MPRLIYADEAKENACKWECGGDPSCPYSKSNGITHDQCEFMRAIDECRTVDAAPVIHGHWIQTQAKDENGNAYYSCSVCGSGECHVPEVNVPYCWKCGSKMDEVTE